MEFTFATIEAALASYLWPFFRIGAMLMTMAVIGSQNVPVRIRLGAALAITVATVPGIPPLPAIPLFSLQSVIITAHQLLIGIAVGLVTQFVMQTFILAGQFIGMQTSLGFANIVDPSNGQTVPVIGQLFLMLATLIFLVIDGHLLLIRMLAESFHSLPVGPEGLDASPRGDPPGLVTVLDAHTLLLPERAGNNRIDSLRNILADPRVGLLFLVPGLNETLRVNGAAQIGSPEIAQFEVQQPHQGHLIVDQPAAAKFGGGLRRQQRQQASGQHHAMQEHAPRRSQGRAGHGGSPGFIRSAHCAQPP